MKKEEAVNPLPLFALSIVSMILRNLREFV